MSDWPDAVNVVIFVVGGLLTGLLFVLAAIDNYMAGLIFFGILLIVFHQESMFQRVQDDD